MELKIPKTVDLKDIVDCPIDLIAAIDSSENEWRKAVVKGFMWNNQTIQKLNSKISRVEIQNVGIISFMAGIFVLVLKTAMGW